MAGIGRGLRAGDVLLHRTYAGKTYTRKFIILG